MDVPTLVVSAVGLRYAERRRIFEGGVCLRAEILAQPQCRLAAWGRALRAARPPAERPSGVRWRALVDPPVGVRLDPCGRLVWLRSRGRLFVSMREVTPGRSVQLTEPFGRRFFEEQGAHATMCRAPRGTL